VQIRGRSAVVALAVVVILSAPAGQAVASADDSGFNTVTDGGARSVFDFRDIIALSDRRVRERLRELRDPNGPIDVADMFEMQMRINHLSQLNEVPRVSPTQPGGSDRPGEPTPTQTSGVAR
jgi:hypothetical protein